MQSLTPPTAEIPIDAMWAGGVVYPLLSVDQRSGRVAVVQHTESVTAWERFLYDLPDWAFWVCVLALLYLAWRVWRVVRTPRAVGRLVCVRCAYDLTPLEGGAIAARCPECGVETAKRPPVIGRMIVRRLRTPLTVTAAVLAVSAAVFVWRLEPAAPFSATRRWPVPVSGLMPGWAQLQRRQPPVTSIESIDVWSVMQNRRIRRVVLPTLQSRWGGTVRQVRVLPGGEFMALTQEKSGITLSLVRVSDGETLWKSDSTMLKGAGAAGFAGSSGDGRRAWFWLLRPTSGTGAEVELTEVVLASGDVRSIGSIDKLPDPDVWGASEVVAAEDGTDVRWACIMATPNGAQVAWSGGGARLTGPAFINRSALQQDPGSGVWSVVVPDGFTTGTSSGGWRVPLDGQAPARIPVTMLAGAGTQIDVLDPASGAVVKSLSTSGASAAPLANATPGDRWHASIGIRNRPRRVLWGLIGLEGSVDGVVQVWDISTPPTPAKP